MYIENKKEFVKDLGHLLSNYGIEGIDSMDYTKEDDIEIVTIHCSQLINGYEKDKWYIKVNVHMDSLLAIIKDIITALYNQ